ncbi:MAG: hypothetical protein V4606_00060 [Patescibacteria group bacterium]
MTLSAKQIWTLSFLSVCAAISLMESTALAQSEASSSTDATASTTTTTVPAVVEKWYTSDYISDTTNAIGDFVVGPGKVEVTVKPGESVTTMMTVTNRIAANKTFTLSVEDMSGSADPSTPVVLLGDKNGPYTLKNNLSFKGTDFTLALGERAQIPVTITMPPDAEPGGYYGAVLVSTIQKNDEDDGTLANSPIVARVGTLFFITVPGAIEQSGQVTEFSAVPKQWFFTSGPVNLGVLFENTGSKHLNPYGEIRVQNIFGEEVGFVEIEPWFVLPKSLRLREIVWDREVLLGRYTITANINRGYEDIVDEKVLHIWVLPWQFLASIFLGVLILIFIIRFIGSRFEFKRKR